MKSAEEALREYDIGRITHVEPLPGGMIHRTWRVDTDRNSFVLQQVSPIFAPSVMADIAAVLAHLKSHNCRVMEIVRTKRGALFIPGETGFWRVFTYVPGRVYGEREATETVAYEAGKLLGRYHRLLNHGFSYQFTHARPIKKNIPLLYRAFQDAVRGNTHPGIAELIPIIDRMPTLDLPPGLRKTVNHGDPKIANFIFAGDGMPRAVTMIDFDDCGRAYNPVLELSSAFRSWSWRKADGRERFDVGQFAAGLRGYDEGSSRFLTTAEREFIPQALELNVLQLASRFVRDFFEDCYFTWDSERYPSRKAHNLARAKEHIALYRDILGKADEIRNIIRASRYATAARAS